MASISFEVRYSTRPTSRMRYVRTYVRGTLHTPITFIKFREKYFREWGDNHEIHQNIIPRKFGAIRYIWLNESHTVSSENYERAHC